MHFFEAAGEFAADIAGPGKVTQIFHLDGGRVDAGLGQYTAAAHAAVAKILIDQIAYFWQQNGCDIANLIFGGGNFQRVVDQQLQRIICQPGAIGIGNRYVGGILEEQ